MDEDDKTWKGQSSTDRQQENQTNETSMTDVLTSQPPTDTHIDSVSPDTPSIDDMNFDNADVEEEGEDDPNNIIYNTNLCTLPAY